MSVVYEWHTTITDVAETSICVRGFPVAEMIRTRNFVEVAFLTLRGRFPQPREQRMLEAGLIALVDDGFISSDLTAARFSVSENPSVVAGVAGGVLAAGTSTLSAENAAAFIEKALEIHRRLGGLLEETASVIVSEIIEKRERIPGLGHVTHKHEDPRVPALRAVASELGWIGERVCLFEAIHKELVEHKGRWLPINACGMLAAILGEMGWSPHEMSGLAVFAALPGLLVRTIEEMTTGARLTASRW